MQRAQVVHRARPGDRTADYNFRFRKSHECEHSSSRVGRFRIDWEIFRDVIAAGDTYVFAEDTPMGDAHAYWFGPGVRSYVAEQDGGVVGMYRSSPTSAAAARMSPMRRSWCLPRGRAKASGGVWDSTASTRPRTMGFLAMQFNFVVSTNVAAVRLWQSLGFTIVGTLPKVFRHRELGFVDAYVMHRSLEPVAQDADAGTRRSGKM